MLTLTPPPFTCFVETIEVWESLVGNSHALPAEFVLPPPTLAFAQGAGIQDSL